MENDKLRFDSMSNFDPAVSRRTLLRGAALAAGALVLPASARLAAAYELSPEANAAIAKSPLLYVSPLKSNGSESTCHGEVWYVADGSDLLVVTSTDRWKAEAIAKGMDQARLWVGDYGAWTRSGGKFKQAPSFAAKASIERDPKAQAKALASFGSKYPDEWDKWGPRFRDGLKDQSRVLIRYAPRAA